MVKEEQQVKKTDSEKKSQPNTSEANRSGLLTGDLSPWYKDRQALNAKLKDLDAYHNGLSENDKKLHETQWQEGRDQILVQLSDLDRKDREGGFISQPAEPVNEADDDEEEEPAKAQVSPNKNVQGGNAEARERHAQGTPPHIR